MNVCIHCGARLDLAQNQPKPEAMQNRAFADRYCAKCIEARPRTEPIVEQRALLPVLKTGCKAYFDSYLGLIPCVVVSIVGITVRAKLTASRGKFETYKRGEIIESTTMHIVPRECVRGRKILAFRIQADENGGAL